MLTPNEVRERLAAVRRAYAADDDDTVIAILVDVLDVVPELIALSSGRSLEDAGRRYRDEVEGERA